MELFNLSTTGKLSGNAPSYLQGVYEYLDSFIVLLMDYLVHHSFYSENIKEYADTSEKFAILFARFCAHQEVLPIYENLKDKFEKKVKDKRTHFGK